MLEIILILKTLSAFINIVNAIPVHLWIGPQVSRRLRLPNFKTDGSGRLYPSGKIPGTHFVQRMSRTQYRSAVGGFMSIKNSNDTTWNRTHDFPDCSVVPQLTAPLHIHYPTIWCHKDKRGDMTQCILTQKLHLERKIRRLRKKDQLGRSYKVFIVL